MIGADGPQSRPSVALSACWHRFCATTGDRRQKCYRAQSRYNFHSIQFPLSFDGPVCAVHHFESCGGGLLASFDGWSGQDVKPRLTVPSAASILLIELGPAARANLMIPGAC